MAPPVDRLTLEVGTSVAPGSIGIDPAWEVIAETKLDRSLANDFPELRASLVSFIPKRIALISGRE